MEAGEFGVSRRRLHTVLMTGTERITVRSQKILPRGTNAATTSKLLHRLLGALHENSPPVLLCALWDQGAALTVASVASNVSSFTLL